MNLPPELAATLQARMASLGATLQTVEHNPTSTIEPPEPSADSAGGRALAVLARLGEATKDIGQALEIERTLGEGGMGVVQLGKQVALGRKVAIKTLHEQQRDSRMVLKLLREAWITGALEHPNVVPVYDISLDAEGRPLIVLKRIEGVHWGELLHDPEALAARSGGSEPLEYNLRVLLDVCDAVRFAHSRGIVHRDLKPENVMIGEFGEVYVLDWGLAVSLRDTGDGRLPLAKDAKELAGTPAYMAPEMLGDGIIDERTDVYLLGSVLYEIAHGKPPHQGANAMAVISSVVLSAPTIDTGVPGDLARICQRAMARVPSDRYQSVDELREAIEGFLQHRSSLRLSRDATRSLDELHRELNDGTRDDAHRLRIYNAFGECRFGFREALREWEGNEPARRGLDEAITAMVEFELGAGDPRAASVLLAELGEPPAELAARVKKALADKEREQREVEAMRRDMDPGIGSRTRTFVGVVLGVVWTLFPALGMHFADYRGSHAGGIVASLVLLGIVVALAVWGRESLSKTAINRRVVSTILVALFCQLMLFIGARQMGLPTEQTFPILFLLYFLAALQFASFLEPRLWPTALAYLTAFLVTAHDPTLVAYAMSAANGVLTINLLVSWGWALKPASRIPPDDSP